MDTNQTPVTLIKSKVGCDINASQLVNSFTVETTTDHKTRERVQRYINHAKKFQGLQTKFASNFHIKNHIDKLLITPGAAFLRFYLASDEDDQGNVTGTIAIIAVTDETGKVLSTVRGDIEICEECCGNPPGNSRFDNDPFL